MFKSDIFDIRKVRFRSNIQCFEFFKHPTVMIPNNSCIFLQPKPNQKMMSKILIALFATVHTISAQNQGCPNTAPLPSKESHQLELIL